MRRELTRAQFASDSCFPPTDGCQCKTKLSIRYSFRMTRKSRRDGRSASLLTPPCCPPVVGLGRPLVMLLLSEWECLALERAKSRNTFDCQFLI